MTHKRLVTKRKTLQCKILQKLIPHTAVLQFQVKIQRIFYYFAIPPPKKDPQRNRLNEYMNDIFCICNYSPLKEIELRNRNSRHFHKFDNFKPLEIHQKLWHYFPESVSCLHAWNIKKNRIMQIHVVKWQNSKKHSRHDVFYLDCYIILSLNIL